MAFFNLTQLGVQDPIKACVKDEPSMSSSEGKMRTSQSAPSISSLAASGEKPKYVSEARGSYVKYTERLTKHQRPELNPNEIYSKPITSSQDYGWWKQVGAPESLPWTKVQHHSRVNSEMTRFVDEMTMTNKHFTLF